MYSNLLVMAGHDLLDAIDQEGVCPRAAVWVRNPDLDAWRLWIVPQQSVTDKREFYWKVAQAISNNRERMGGLDVSDTQFTSENHPAIQALGKAFKVVGHSSVSIKDNMLDGYYLPDGIILRMAV